MTNRLLLILGCFLGLTTFSSGQSLRAWIQAADSAFAQRDFYPAFKYYEAALKYDTARTDLWYRYAESAFEFQAYPYAVNAYTRVLNSTERNAYPHTLLRMAEAYHILSEYDQAALYYQRFIDEQPGAAPSDLAKADKGLRDIRFAQQVLENRGNLDVRNLGEGINSPFSDFGAVYYADTLYYTSYKFVDRKDTYDPPRPFNKIMSSVKGGPGNPLPDYFNEPGKHVAHSAFNHDFSRIYYTICEYTGPTDIRCDLYFRNRAAQGWGPAQRMTINATGYTNTEPSVGRNPVTGEELLYFVSDRPGGRGGLDIWYAALQTDGSCSTPVNLTALNTTGNDVTPFFHDADQVLYFSSDGHPGLGGYDIFRAFKRGSGWDAPENMGLPFNSSFHDVYFALNEDGTVALLSSNRPGAIFMDKEKAVCCYDIWEIQLAKPFRLDVLAFFKPDGTPLSGVTVQLYELTPDGQERLVNTLVNPSSNDFSFLAARDRRYVIKGSKEGYIPASERIDLNDPQFAGKEGAEVKLFLDQPQSLKLEVLALRADRRALQKATVSLWEVMPDGREVLRDTLTNLTSNDFTFNVERGKKYVIRGSREPYFPALETLDLTNLANLPPDNTIRKELIFRQNTVVDVSTFNALTRERLDSVRVTVFRINPDGAKEEVATALKSTDNQYKFDLDPGYVYEIVGERDAYGPAVQILDLRDREGAVSVELYLPPAKAMEVTTFRKLDGKPLPSVLVELYELKSSGERVFITSQTNPTANDTRFSVEDDKQYVLKASHPGYFPVTETLDMRDPVLKRQQLVKKQLYLEPAQVNLEVVTLRRADRAPVNGSTVKLYEVGPNGQETLVSTLTNRNGNDFTFPLATGKLYIIRGDNPVYYPAEERIDLRDPATAASGTVRRELLFEQPLPVKTFDAQTRRPLNGVLIELREIEGTRTKRVELKENPDGNDFTFPVLPGRSYLLIAERPGYQRAVDTLKIPADPNRKLETVEVYLRQKNFSEFLPLALFFDNDHPNPRTTLSTTTLDYGQTFDRYYARKQEFINEFTRGENLSEDDRFLIEESYENFFERELRGGYRDLQAFCAKLVEFLREGNTVDIELRGYASPRGASQYNLILSRRRASCVNNYFYRYQNGALMEFIRNGKLRIGKIGFGEETPDPIRASDRFEDLKGSVFSTQASIARRVEILDVKIGENNNK